MHEIADHSSIANTDYSNWKFSVKEDEKNSGESKLYKAPLSLYERVITFIFGDKSSVYAQNKAIVTSFKARQQAKFSGVPQFACPSVEQQEALNTNTITGSNVKNEIVSKKETIEARSQDIDALDTLERDFNARVEVHDAPLSDEDNAFLSEVRAARDLLKSVSEDSHPKIIESSIIAARAKLILATLRLDDDFSEMMNLDFIKDDTLNHEAKLSLINGVTELKGIISSIETEIKNIEHALKQLNKNDKNKIFSLSFFETAGISIKTLVATCSQKSRQLSVMAAEFDANA